VAGNEPDSWLPSFYGSPAPTASHRVRVALLERMVKFEESTNREILTSLSLENELIIHLY
jgi:hypothetical protein